jgi:hypothetical protein
MFQAKAKWFTASYREDKVAKGQLRSNREKKKPKAEKNKKKSAPVPSVFERVRMIGKDVSGKKFS